MAETQADMAETQADEVRLDYLRPHQIRDRRRRADLAFLPIGTLEWHGVHNPIGLDAVTAHHVCREAARKLGGGAVAPALCLGVPRDSFHIDIAGDEPTTALIAEAYGTDPATVRGRSTQGGMDPQEQWLFYQRLLRMTLEQIAAFGFASIYLVSGHAPLVHFVRPVAIAFTRATRMGGRIVTTDWANAPEPAGIPVAGGHGGRWETEQQMAAAPHTVDLTALRDNPRYRGIGSGADAVEATLERGRQSVDACAAAIAAEARWLVEHYPQLPPRHRHGR